MGGGAGCCQTPSPTAEREPKCKGKSSEVRGEIRSEGGRQVREHGEWSGSADVREEESEEGENERLPRLPACAHYAPARQRLATSLPPCDSSPLPRGRLVYRQAIRDARGADDLHRLLLWTAPCRSQEADQMREAEGTGQCQAQGPQTDSSSLHWTPHRGVDTELAPRAVRAPSKQLLKGKRVVCSGSSSLMSINGVCVESENSKATW